MDSLLKTNIAIASEPDWHEIAMSRRASTIAALAIKLWPSPDPSTVATSAIAQVVEGSESASG